MFRLFWSFIRKFLFLFDAEWVHELTIDFIAFCGKHCPALLRWLAKVNDIEKIDMTGVVDPFSNICHPVGLAAGFDKNGLALQGLASMGFSFVEIGTVTPRPQHGNTKPRLWRLSQLLGLFNRMGFNNAGAIQVAKNLELAKPKLPSDFIVGVNIGKNKNTLEGDSPSDYRLAASAFKNLADYISINISSPNTPGLRDLQEVNSLKEIMKVVKSEISTWTKTCPVYVKLAPELTHGQLKNFFDNEKLLGVDGWILSNTLKYQFRGHIGGLSGKPLSEIANETLIFAKSNSTVPIISVGGIMNPKDAICRLQNGASVIQVYSGWIYSGPCFVRDIVCLVSEPRT